MLCRARRILALANQTAANIDVQLTKMRILRVTMVKMARVDADVQHDILDLEVRMKLGPILLAAWLDEHGVQRQDFAATIGMSKSSLSQYLLGKRFPSAETTAKFEAATDRAVPMQAWVMDARELPAPALRQLKRALRTFWSAAA